MQPSLQFADSRPSTPVVRLQSESCHTGHSAPSCPMSTDPLCQYNMSCSNVLAKMHLQRCCDCSQYRRQVVDQTGQYYFIAVCLVLLVAQQYKPKHAFLVVSLYASSKDSLFSFKQLHCSSSKLSGFGDGLTQNCLCAAHRLLCKSVHYNLTATNCYCHVTGPRCHPG